MVHAVGRVNGDNHADSFLSNGRIGVEGDPHQRQCQEREGEATQDKNEQVFNLDLTGSGNQSLAQKLHGRPVGLAAVFPVKEVNDDWYCDAKQANDGPKSD